MNLMVLAVAFLGGTVVYLYRERIPDFFRPGWPSSALPRTLQRCTYVPSSLTALSACRRLLSASSCSRTRCSGWARIRLSIGSVPKTTTALAFDIYAYPLTELLAILGAQRIGFWLFMFVLALLTLVLAMATWWVIESVRQLKKASWPTSRLLPAIVVRGVHEASDAREESEKPEVAGH